MSLDPEVLARMQCMQDMRTGGCASHMRSRCCGWHCLGVGCGRGPGPRRELLQDPDGPGLHQEQKRDVHSARVGCLGNAASTAHSTAAHERSSTSAWGTCWAGHASARVQKALLGAGARRPPTGTPLATLGPLLTSGRAPGRWSQPSWVGAAQQRVCSSRRTAGQGGWGAGRGGRRAGHAGRGRGTQRRPAVGGGRGQRAAAVVRGRRACGGWVGGQARSGRCSAGTSSLIPQLAPTPPACTDAGCTGQEPLTVTGKPSNLMMSIITHKTGVQPSALCMVRAIVHVRRVQQCGGARAVLGTLQATAPRITPARVLQQLL